jgi:hypothetical protein
MSEIESTPESRLKAVLNDDLLALRDAEKVAQAKWRAAREAHNDAEKIDSDLWDAWNATNIALFSAAHPDIAAEVVAINTAKNVLDNRTANIRQIIQDRGLKLPQYFLG